MAIGKMLNLGGLENSPPNTSQSPNRFKVAKNVVINKNNHITPRPSMEGFTENTVDGVQPVDRWTHFSSYEDVGTNTRKVLKFGVDETSSINNKWLFLDNTLVPSFAALYDSSASTPYNNNFSDQSVEYNRVKYLLSSPSKAASTLLKYDGYEAYSAGIGIPFFEPLSASSSLEPGYSTTTGSRYVKVISHSLDMQGNSITSDSVSYRTTGTVQNFKSMASGTNINGTKIVVGVGDSGISYSYDGVNWDANVMVSGSVFTSFPLECVCFGTPNGSPLFVAITSSTTFTRHPVFISEDGINWRRTLDSSLLSIPGGWTSVTWASNRFVAVRNVGGATARERVMWSSDGIVWQYATTVPSISGWTSVAYGGSGAITLVAIASTATTTTSLMTSADGGVTWINRTIPTAIDWRSVVWGIGSSGGRWVAVARTGTTTTNVITSSDAITWASVATTVPTTGWTSVTYYNNSLNPAPINYKFIAVNGTLTAANKIMVSDNGTTWTGVTGANTLDYRCVNYFDLGTPDNTIVAGALLLPLSTAKGLMYAKESSITSTWIEADNPITTLLNIATSADVNNFLAQTNNPTYFENPGEMLPYFYGKAQFNSITNKFDLTFTELNGVSWGIKTFGLNSIYLIRPINFIIISGAQSVKYSAIAYKVTADGLNFEPILKILNSNTLLWEDINASTLPISSGYFVASRRHYTVWASPSATGIFYYKGYATAAGNNLFRITFCVNIRDTNIENVVQKASNLPFFISGTLNDWYDVNSAKLSFNQIAQSDNFVSLTIYQDLLVLASRNIIYFSDSTTGGSLEMTSGLASTVIGDSGQGNITSVVGTKDYLIVSRERKVYMVAGSLPSGQIRVQEIQGIPVGAYSNSSMLEVEGNVILLSSVGVWQINSSNAKKLSSGIELNFQTFMKKYVDQQPSAENDSITFDMNSYPANAYAQPNVKKYITSAYDSYRGLVVFTDSSTSKCGESLVLNATTGEFTNWDSFDTDTFELSAMTFIEGKQFNGTISDLGVARTSSEDKSTSVFTYDYSTRSPSKLITTWMTAGEPSLEKQVLQLKMFGYIWSDLAIKHYQNWDLSTAITDTTYTSPGDTSPKNYIMFHKQRLNSSKAMAVAMELGMKAGGKSFWIEGLEVEFESIQVGMKR